jgi:hypothetical protein
MTRSRNLSEDASRAEKLTGMIEGKQTVEAVHLLGSVLMGGSALLALSIGNPVGAGVWFGINLYMNVFPTALQRYLRLRASAALERLRERDASLVASDGGV